MKKHSRKPKTKPKRPAQPFAPAAQPADVPGPALPASALAVEAYIDHAASLWAPAATADPRFIPSEYMGTAPPTVEDIRRGDTALAYLHSSGKIDSEDPPYEYPGPVPLWEVLPWPPLHERAPEDRPWPWTAAEAYPYPLGDLFTHGDLGANAFLLTRSYMDLYTLRTLPAPSAAHPEHAHRPPPLPLPLPDTGLYTPGLDIPLP